MDIYGFSMDYIPVNIIKIMKYLTRFKTEIQFIYYQLSNFMIVWVYMREGYKFLLRPILEKLL